MFGENMAPKVALFACNGANRAGQIGNEAIRTLARNGHGIMCCATPVAAADPEALSNATRAGKRIVVDGCAKCCLQKAFVASNLKVDSHIVVTDLGVDSAGSLDFAEEQIAAVASAIRDSIRQPKAVTVAK